MRAVFVSAVVAFLSTILLTPVAIRGFARLGAGQPIRTDGPQSHLVKKGTPTMGGVVFILATVIAYVAGHFVLATLPARQLGAPTGITTTGVVLLGLLIGLGAVGFVDDFLKVRKRNSLGLSKRQKLFGQTVVGLACGYAALWFPSSGVEHETVAASTISFLQTSLHEQTCALAGNASRPRGGPVSGCSRVSGAAVSGWPTPARRAG